MTGQELVITLKEVAKANKISMTTIAKETGFHYITISRMFNLKSTASLDVFCKVAAYLGVNVLVDQNKGAVFKPVGDVDGQKVFREVK